MDSHANCAFAGIASTLILGVVSLHALHRPSRVYTSKFLQLSYASQTDQTYKQGFDDVYFVIAWVVNFTALRAISIDWILRPAAKHLGVARKSHLRFAEQGWLVLYYGTFWTLGMVCPPRSPSPTMYRGDLDSYTGTAASLGQFALLAEQPGHMDQLACKRNVRYIQMVLPRPIGILGPTNPCYPH